MYKIDSIFDGKFKVPEGFSGNRNIDTVNAIMYLNETYGIDKITKGFILHHDIDNGIFKLIREDIHETFKHYGVYYYNK